ncbi:MAG: hypothetical protein Q9212_007472 [Teloschistes hypoglaucus]
MPQMMIGLRSVAFRVLSASKPTPSLACRSRSITTAISSPSRYRLTTQSPIFSLQRRFASEEVQTQSEPAADREHEAQHGDNSIAAASRGQSEQSFEDVAKNTGQQAGSSLGEFASAAAAKVKETAEDAFGSSDEGTAYGSSFRKRGSAPVSSIYIGNLFFDVKEQDLRDEFSKCGEIESIKLIMDNRGLSKGFGYVNFTSVEAASAAIRDYDNTPFSGRRLSVQYASPRTSPAAGGGVSRPVNRANEPTRTLFIGNMSFDMSDRELNQLFREVRNVVDVRVAIDRRTGQPRGFAHADFTDVDSAREAMLALSGKEVSGRRLRVDYSISSGTSVGARQTTPAQGM